MWSVIVFLHFENMNLIGSLFLIFVALLSRFFMVLRSFDESVLWSKELMNSRHFFSLLLHIDIWMRLFSSSIFGECSSQALGLSFCHPFLGFIWELRNHVLASAWRNVVFWCCVYDFPQYSFTSVYIRWSRLVSERTFYLFLKRRPVRFGDVDESALGSADGFQEWWGWDGYEDW